jgi:hypothetical protein
MEASIKVTLKLEGESYEIDLGIPSGSPTNDKPYKFSVLSKKTDGSAGDTLLDLAVGGKNNGGTTNFHVSLAPPQTVLPGETVEDLSVNVDEGTYSKATGKFS